MNEYSAPSNEEVVEHLKVLVPSFREAVPEIAVIEPVARDGDFVELRVDDGANENAPSLFITVPLEDGALFHPEYACCEQHHDAAMTRLRRIFAAAFN
jgi:hypothetical protein